MNKSRCTLLWTPVMVAAVLAGAAGTANASLPSGVTHVGATAGSTTSGIDGHVHPAASIAGTIKSVAGGKPLSTLVTAYRGGKLARLAVTDGTGHYVIGGLAPSSTGYAVCVDGRGLTGGGSTTGYLGRCYKTAFWNGGSIPSGATKVPLTSGQQKTGINVNMPSGAAIAGTVTSAGGAGLNLVRVYAHNRSNGLTYTGDTTSTGSYSVKGLTASATGYTVCFDPWFVTQGTTGFRPLCFKNTPWNGGSTYPSTATPVPVTLGKTHSGISSSLPVGGAISGTITDASSGNPVKNERVVVFNPSGKLLATATTNSQGNYTAKGLAAATGDRVCALPESPSASVSYKGRCWKNVAWNGGNLPPGTTPVSVNLGQTHTGISLKLGRTTIALGSIAGKITEKAGGNALQSASVSVYTSGGSFVASASTNASGIYKVSGLRASSTGYVVCAQGDSAFSGVVSPPPTGWAPRCYTDVAWEGTKPPDGATKVPLSAGQNKTGINIGLHVGGEIAGTVFVNGGSTPAPGVLVDLYTAGGSFIKSTSSDFTTGAYSFKGLSPDTATATTGYTVCFDGRADFASPPGYLPQCYNDVAWNGSA